jgi:hypothetical protein
MKTMVFEGSAGYSPPTQLAVCQLRHRQDLSLSALCALACSYTASAVQIALSHRVQVIIDLLGSLASDLDALAVSIVSSGVNIVLVVTRSWCSLTG